MLRILGLDELAGGQLGLSLPQQLLEDFALLQRLVDARADGEAPRVEALGRGRDAPEAELLLLGGVVREDLGVGQVVGRLEVPLQEEQERDRGRLLAQAQELRLDRVLPAARPGGDLLPLQGVHGGLDGIGVLRDQRADLVDERQGAVLLGERQHRPHPRQEAQVRQEARRAGGVGEVLGERPEHGLEEVGPRALARDDLLVQRPEVPVGLLPRLVDRAPLGLLVPDLLAPPEVLLEMERGQQGVPELGLEEVGPLLDDVVVQQLQGELGHPGVPVRRQRDQHRDGGPRRHEPLLQHGPRELQDPEPDPGVVPQARGAGDVAGHVVNVQGEGQDLALPEELDDAPGHAAVVLPARLGDRGGVGGGGSGHLHLVEDQALALALQELGQGLDPGDLELGVRRDVQHDVERLLDALGQRHLRPRPDEEPEPPDRLLLQLRAAVREEPDHQVRRVLGLPDARRGVLLHQVRTVPPQLADREQAPPLQALPPVVLAGALLGQRLGPLDLLLQPGLVHPRHGDAEPERPGVEPAQGAQQPDGPDDHLQELACRDDPLQVVLQLVRDVLVQGAAHLRQQGVDDGERAQQLLSAAALDLVGLGEARALRLQGREVREEAGDAMVLVRGRDSEAPVHHAERVQGQERLQGVRLHEVLVVQVHRVRPDLADNLVAELLRHPLHDRALLLLRVGQDAAQQAHEDVLRLEREVDELAVGRAGPVDVPDHVDDLLAVQRQEVRVVHREPQLVERLGDEHLDRVLLVGGAGHDADGGLAGPWEVPGGQADLP